MRRSRGTGTYRSTWRSLPVASTRHVTSFADVPAAEASRVMRCRMRWRSSSKRTISGRDALRDEVIVGPDPPCHPGIERVVEVRPVFHDRYPGPNRAADAVLGGHRSRVDPAADQESDVDRVIERACGRVGQPDTREGGIPGLVAAMHAMAVLGQAAFGLLERRSGPSQPAAHRGSWSCPDPADQTAVPGRADRLHEAGTKVPVWWDVARGDGPQPRAHDAPRRRAASAHGVPSPRGQ